MGVGVWRLEGVVREKSRVFVGRDGRRNGGGGTRLQCNIQRRKSERGRPSDKEYVNVCTVNGLNGTRPPLSE